MERIASNLGADVVTTFLYDMLTFRFHLPVGCGLNDQATFEDPRLCPRSGRVAGKIVRERRRIVAGEVPGHMPMDGPFARRERIKSAAGFPLLDGDKAVGVLFVSFRAPHPFSEEELDAIQGESQRLGADRDGG